MSKDNDIKRITEVIKGIIARAPVEIGVLAVNHFKENFRIGGFVYDKNVNKWAGRKKNKQQHPLLLKRGNLRSSIRVFRANQREIVIGSSLSYARIHNEGGEIIQYPRSDLFTRNRYVRGPKKGQYKKGTQSGRGSTYGKRVITIPKRQFIGDSPALTRKMDAWYLNNLKKAKIIK